MFKKFFTLIISIIFILAIWAFIEYKQVASEAEAQINLDIAALKQQFNEQRKSGEGAFEEAQYENFEWVDSRLMQQSINENQQFVRHYRSLFIHQAHTRCLLSQVIYPQRQVTILSQRWLAEGMDCLPL